MAMIRELLAIILVLFLISLFHIPEASSKPSGFSLKLIRDYSFHSAKNSTFQERYESYVQATEDRGSYWTSFHKSTANTTIQPDEISTPLRTERNRIVALMMIGTPAQPVYLEFDTGSIASWTQCTSCTICFPQSTAKFDPKKSSSYREMPYNDYYCKSPYFRYNQKCQYKFNYISGQYSKGVVAYETFRDTNPFKSVVTDIRFGCALEAVGFNYGRDTIISGLLSMGKDIESFPKQLSKAGGKGRFSYCLVDINTSPTLINTVTFGDDTPKIPRQYVSTVPFITKPNLPHAWAINIIDISVGQERLNLPPGTFAENRDRGNGPLVIDTGAPLTYITRNAYLRIAANIENHLSNRIGFTKFSNGSLKLCYRYNGSLRRLPKQFLQTITLHLDNNARLYMPVTSVYLFNWDANTFCLGILEASSKFPNILGALSQQDTRFVYDFDKNYLSLYHEVCGRN